MEIWFFFEFIIFIMDIMKMDPLAFRNISKRHFLRGIEKSFQEVTPMGLEAHQFFFFLKYFKKHGY